MYDNLVPCTVLTKPLVKKLKKAIPELDVSKIFIDELQGMVDECMA